MDNNDRILVTEVRANYGYRGVMSSLSRSHNAPDLPGEDWALRIGDCIHNLRAALDYIAWRLAGSRPTDTQTQFPIFNTKPGWDTTTPVASTREAPDRVRRHCR